jgi:NitT/TauT family transport system ATP-binding protein
MARSYGSAKINDHDAVGAGKSVSGQSIGTEKRGPLLDASGVGLAFQDHEGRAIRVLRDINLTVHKQEIVAILGPSGCGKTTLLRIMAGLLTPTEGVFKADPALMARRGIDMTMVFQKPTLLPWFSVEENALLPFRLAELPVDESIRERADQLFRLVRLQGFRASRPQDLSGGMQMRAALIRAFMPRPRLILMDEPFSALDEATRLELCLEVLRLIEASDSSVVFVTHSIQEAALLAGRVLQISARPGRVIAEFVPDYQHPRDRALLDRPEFLDLCTRLRAQLFHE